MQQAQSARCLLILAFIASVVLEAHALATGSAALIVRAFFMIIAKIVAQGPPNESFSDT
jgi:hypothetical protein